MRYILLVLILNLTSLTFAEESAALAAGVDVISKDGHFQIQLPPGFLKPEAEVQPIQTELGEIETINYTSFSENSAAMVGSSTYPEALLVFIKGKEQEVLDGAEEGALRNVNGTVSSKEDRTLQGFPARSMEFTAETEGQPLYGRALFILADSHLYHVLFISNNKDELKTETTNRFFNSFKIER